MTELKESIRNFYKSLKPFIESGLIAGWSCAPEIPLITELLRHGIDAKYIIGAKIMTIEGKPITVITGDMNRTHGSIYCAPNDGNYYVPYSILIETLAKLLGAGRKVAPFADPLPASKFLLDWYWKKLTDILKEN